MTWRRKGIGLGSDRVLSVLALRNGDLFAGTGGRGVFGLASGAYYWVSTNDGLFDSTITTLAIDSAGHLVAGTVGGGIYRSADSVTALGVDLRHDPTQVGFDVFPIPVSNLVHVSCEVLPDPIVSVRILSIDGRVRLNFGTFRSAFDLTLNLQDHLPPGVYLIEIGGRATHVCKPILVDR
jgi:hypothetical protein